MDELPRFVTVDDYEPVARERLAAGRVRLLRRRRRRRVDARGEPTRVRSMEPAAPGPARVGPARSVDDDPRDVRVASRCWWRRGPTNRWRIPTASGRPRARPRRRARSWWSPPRRSTCWRTSSAASDGPKWWQLYVFEDRSVTADMLARVVDGRIRSDLPHGRPPRLRPAAPGHAERVRAAASAARHRGLPCDSMLSWDDIAWLRERTPGLSAPGEGYPHGRGRGAGGRTRASTGSSSRTTADVSSTARPPGVTALPEVVGAVAGRVPVLVDGGIRRGTDVVKALALGADAVLVGRPCVWGLAVDGEAGVADVLGILRAEFENAMALCGCRTVAEITPALVAPGVTAARRVCHHRRSWPATTSTPTRTAPTARSRRRSWSTWPWSAG